VQRVVDRDIASGFAIGSYIGSDMYSVFGIGGHSANAVGSYRDSGSAVYSGRGIDSDRIGGLIVVVTVIQTATVLCVYIVLAIVIVIVK